MKKRRTTYAFESCLLVVVTERVCSAVHAYHPPDLQGVINMPLWDHMHALEIEDDFIKLNMDNIKY